MSCIFQVFQAKGGGPDTTAGELGWHGAAGWVLIDFTAQRDSLEIETRRRGETLVLRRFLMGELGRDVMPDPVMMADVCCCLGTAAMPQQRR